MINDHFSHPFPQLTHSLDLFTFGSSHAPAAWFNTMIILMLVMNFSSTFCNPPTSKHNKPLVTMVICVDNMYDILCINIYNIHMYIII